MQPSASAQHPALFLQTEGAAAPKSRSRETKRETALKTALAHAEAELLLPDLMYYCEPTGGRAPMLISARPERPSPSCLAPSQPRALSCQTETLPLASGRMSRLARRFRWRLKGCPVLQDVEHDRAFTKSYRRPQAVGITLRSIRRPSISSSLQWRTARHMCSTHHCQRSISYTATCRFAPPWATCLCHCTWCTPRRSGFCPAGDDSSSVDVSRLANDATDAAILRPLHRQSGGRDEEPAPYFAWQPVAGASQKKICACATQASHHVFWRPHTQMVGDRPDIVALRALRQNHLWLCCSVSALANSGRSTITITLQMSALVGSIACCGAAQECFAPAADRC